MDTNTKTEAKRLLTAEEYTAIRKPNHYRLTFGKHKNTTLQSTPTVYLRWLHDKLLDGEINRKNIVLLWILDNHLHTICNHEDHLYELKECIEEQKQPIKVKYEFIPDEDDIVLSVKCN